MAGALTLLAQAARDGDGPTTLQPGGDPGTSPLDDGGSGFCSISEDEIFQGAVRDAIPALSDPDMSVPESSDFGFLDPNDRVVGLIRGSVALAVPLNILWWHEMVNVWFEGRRIAVTHCPRSEVVTSDTGFSRSGFWASPTERRQWRFRSDGCGAWGA